MDVLILIILVYVVFVILSIATTEMLVRKGILTKFTEREIKWGIMPIMNIVNTIVNLIWLKTKW